MYYCFAFDQGVARLSYACLSNAYCAFGRARCKHRTLRSMVPRDACQAFAVAFLWENMMQQRPGFAIPDVNVSSFTCA